MNISTECRRLSYQRMKGEISRKIKDQIMVVLAEKGPMTARELSEMLVELGFATDDARQYTAPRLSELKKEGKVEVIGSKLCHVTGRPVSVYARKEAA